MGKTITEEVDHVSNKCLNSAESENNENKIIPLETDKKPQDSDSQKTEDCEYMLPLYEEAIRGIIVFDSKDRIINISDSFIQITGVDKKHISGATPANLLKTISGKNLDLETISAKKDFKINIFNPSKNIVTPTFIKTFPVFKKTGSPAGTAIILEPAQYLKKEKIEHSERSNKLKAMGEISGAMAHEIRNPLGSIALFASMIKSGMVEPEEIVKFTDHILTSVKKLECLISNLMIFSNPPKPAYSIIEANSMINGFLDSIEFLLKQNSINLEKYFSEESVLLRADSELLKQAILNLLLNSIQSMPKGGTITIDTHTDYDLKDYQEGAFIIELSDTGCGIPKDNFEKVFLPFFSTKDKQAGIGLSIVNNLIEAHRGHIEASSINQEGAKFRIFFPLGVEETGV